MRSVGIKLMADVANFTRNIGGTAVTSVKNLSGELDKANKAGKLDRVSDAALGIGVGLVGVAGIVTKFAMDFDKQMSSVKAATHANATEMDSLRKAALQAGKDTQYSATEAGKGIEELSKAGVSTADILGGGLRGALDLAAAGQIDVGEAAETAASAMTQFRLEGGKVPHVADLLAAGAGKAQGSVHDMGMALNQSGLVASQMGLSIEDTTGTLASFASAGLIGSDAGTSFKTMLLMLQNPTAKSAELMKSLGINAYDAQGNFVGITQLAGQLQTKLSGLTQAQRDAALAQIFGSDAIRAANILYRQGQTGLQDWITKTNDAGYAAETAATKTDNLAGDLERLKGSLETLAIESGSGANGGLRTIAQGADRLVASISTIPGPVQQAAVGIAGISGAALLAAAGAAKMQQATGRAMDQLSGLGRAGEWSAGKLGAVTKAAGRVGVSLAVLQTASAAFGSSLTPQVNALSQGMLKFATDGKVAGETARLFGGDMGNLDTALKDVADTGAWSSFARGAAGMAEGFTGLGNVMDDSLTKSRERLQALDAALQQMVQSGNAAGAAQVFQAIADRAKSQGVSIAELKNVLPGYAAAVSTAGTSSSIAAGGVAAVGKAADTSADKIKELEDRFNSLFDSEMGLDRANIAFRQGQAKVTDELKNGTRILDLNKDAGLKNRSAVLDQIGTIKELRDARIKHGMSLDEANRKYVKDIDGLRKVALSLGFNKKDVDALIGSYRRVPPAVQTKVTTPGLPQSDRGIKDYDKKLDALARQIRTQVNVVGVSGAEAQLKTLLIQQQALKKGISISAARSAFNKNAGDGYGVRRAGGGPISGPGGPTADMIPAMVSNGEYVQQTSAVDYYGVAAMDALNNRQIPKEALAAFAAYARGGLVLNVPFPVNAAMTRIPSKAEAMAAVRPAFGGGAQTLDFIIRAVHSRFPGMGLISGYRPGAHTLSGNLSYHALHRAADWPASYELAKWWNANYKAQTKEFISPWNSLNIHNGQRHSYTGAIYRQHSGANAHDHIAMANGGVINEPVYGIGASGRSYSFAERGIETVIPGGPSTAFGGNTTTVNLNVQVAAGANMRAAGQQIAEQLQPYLAAGGTIVVRGKTVLGAG